ncbi:MAG TPA: FecR domain-containing protein, partial [Blastocatellia bacterium]|nr:FecR domain-containing protein [Blastocatellia bacterium]
MRLARIAALAVLIFGLTGSALSQERRPISPQERNQYVISVRAGAVNIVEGDVTFQNENGKWDLLIAGDSLSDGNRVKTGQDGRAEILLSPGSYLRLSKNTEIVFTETALDRLKIEVLNGCAYVEAARTDWDPGLLATVVTPQGEFFIAKGGLYRFNVTPDNRTEALVRKGRLLMRDSSIPRGGKKAWIEIPTDYGTMKVAGVGISENKRVVVEGGQPAIFSFKKEYEDEFDLWSKDRAKTLIAGNRRLKGRSGLGPVNVSAWVLDPFHGGFWFWPAYYGFRSP